jgi:hypothetical protein
MGLEESYDAIQQGLTNASPQASQQLNQMLAEITPQLDQLEDDQLNMLLQLVQYLNDHPEEYSQRVKELVDQDIIDEGDFPPDFDPEFLSALGTILLHALRSRQGGAQAAPEMTPPATMARGGIAEAARQVAGSGRGQDTMLAHITPREAAILRSHGGMGTINPQTGLPEYGLFDFIGKALKGVGNAVKSVVKGVGNAVKTVLKSPIGKILGTVALATFLGPGAFGISGLGLGAAASMGLASAGTTLLAGGSLKQALISGATAYFGAPGGAVSNFVGQAGITNMAANAAASAGLVGVGAGLLSGQKLADAVKTGLTAGAVSGLTTGMTQGFGTSIPKVEAPSVPTDLSAASNAPTSVGVETSPVTAGSVDGTPLPPQGATAPPVSMEGPMGPPAPAGMGENFMGPPAPPASSGIGSIWGKTKELYNEYLSPSEIQKRGIEGAKADALKAYNADIANGVPKEIAAAGYTEAIKAGTPGMFATYGPLVGAGLGVTALMGGFKQSKPQETEVQKSLRDPNYGTRLIEQDPAKYLTQNLPGLTYDSRGAIIKSSPWSPQTAGPISVEAKEYVPYTPSPYITPSGAIGGGGRTIAQPYNTSSMYDFMPRYAAEGGIMEVEPVHMRRGGTLAPALLPQIIAAEAQRNAAAAPAPSPVAMAAPAFVPPVPTAAPVPIPEPVTVAPAKQYVPVQYAPPQAPQQAVVMPQQELAAVSTPMQISDLARRMYPSLYDEEYRKRIMGNMSGGSGIASLAKGGYPRRTGQISGPGTGTSDSIPAMLSDGEFVMTAKAVRGAGKGSRRAGAKKMYALMHQLERNAARG